MSEQFDTVYIDDYLFNLTAVISGSTAEAEQECYASGWSIYQYFLMRKAQFPTWTDFLEAFL